MSASASPQLIAWGSYDCGKPRVRLLLEVLKARRALDREINIDVWRGIEDKSVAGARRLLGALWRLLIGYPLALWRLARQPSDRVIVLLYPAVIDIFVVWPLARLRGQRIVFDAFIPLHDTIVADRRRLRAGGLLARALWQLERAALRLADVILVDTDAHGCYFAGSFDLPGSKFVTSLVGAESPFWNARDHTGENPALALPDRPFVLFYGQLIPLHGLATILEAVARTAEAPFHWLIVGRGQDEPLLRRFIEDRSPANLSWVPWVDYPALPALIRRAAVSLGVFGTSDKAARVIPNKVFQILAAGGAVITRESPAVAELGRRFSGAVRLVPAGNSEALAAAVAEAVRHADRRTPVAISERSALSPAPGVDRLLAALQVSGDQSCLSS